MKNYEKYKPSGVEWVGAIPQHWNIERTKWVFNESMSRNRDATFTDQDLLSVSEYYGVGKRVEKIGNNDLLNRAESLSEYKVVKRGDLVINIMLAWKKGLGVSDYQGIVSPSYCVFTSRIKNINPKYCHYLYRTDLYAELFRQNSTGIIESRLRLYPEEFFNTETILPPLPEQTAIANYLDEKTARIDKLIANKQRLIELLKEERTAIINQAVTKGINPNVKLKPSGLDWLGDIPEHWEVKKLKYVAEVRDEVIEYAEFKIAVENIESGTGKLINMEEDKDYQGTLSTFLKGDTIFNKLRPYLHKVYLAEKDGGLYGELLVFFSKGELLSEFLFYKLFSKSFIDIVDSSTYGTKMPRANWDDFISHLLIAYPKDKIEQQAIVQHIESHTSRIDATISKIEKEIELLQEYRTALISEVVTGKICAL